MTYREFVQISQDRCTLGEGLHYDAGSGELSWVDIPGSRHFVLARHNGEWLSGGLTGLHLSDRSDMIIPPGFTKGEALNDGATHPSGEWVVFGSRDINEQEPVGHVWLMGQKPVQLPWRVTVFNGPAFCPDGTYLYFADSPTGQIWDVPFDAESGRFGDRELFTAVPPEHGFPDGMICDDKGYLWSAHWDGSRITRYDPAGNVMSYVAVPTRNPTSLAFWGENRDQLALTSAVPEDTADQGPLDGHVLSFAAGVAGPPATLYSHEK